MTKPTSDWFGRHSKQIQVFAILLAFSVGSSLLYVHGTGDDLASSYFGCKVLAAGGSQHLYSQDPQNFDEIGDPLWQDMEDESLPNDDVFVHPYVQTPLWAFSIRPLCRNLSYPSFTAIFIGLDCACFAALIWVIAAAWTPSLLQPAWIAAIALLFFASVPIRYALNLAQTHILFLLPAVLAIIFARRFPIVAGALLAIAAAVKITPAYLVLYWFLTRRYKAGFSFILCSAGLVLLTVGTTGSALFATYLHRLMETSNVLLVSFNNQSFAAWIMGHKFSPDEFEAWHSFPLPASLKVASLILAPLAAVAGAGLDKRATDRPPYGAIFTLIASTIFAPIAWSHYFFLLLIPTMMLLDVARKRRSMPLLGALGLIVALNLIPTTIITEQMHIIRPQFYAAAVCLAALAFLANRRSAITRQDELDQSSLQIAA